MVSQRYAYRHKRVVVVVWALCRPASENAMSTSTPRGGYREMRGVMLIAMAWRLERFVINRNRAVKERVVLGREVKKLKHRRADHPLIANQRLDDVRIGIARTRD